jgi:hypothetical protein
VKTGGDFLFLRFTSMLVTSNMAFGWGDIRMHKSARNIWATQNNAWKLIWFDAFKVLEELRNLSNHADRKNLLNSLSEQEFVALYDLYYSQWIAKRTTWLSEIDRGILLAIEQTVYTKGMQFAKWWSKIPHVWKDIEEYWTRLPILEPIPLSQS